jgi:hypothetical protein
VTALTLAANNGSMGGGEVMLLRTAEVARDLGVPVSVVGPSAPSELVDASRDAGLPTEVVHAANRRAYMRGLRAWDRGRSCLLWCNGLVPALATAGRPRRVVHLHQLPHGPQTTAMRLARWRSELVVVPSDYMSSRVRHATVLPNWTQDPTQVGAFSARAGMPARVGFLGRLSQEKGVDVLAQAVGLLNRRRQGSVQLVLAGDYRFVPPSQESAVRAALASISEHVVDLGWVERDVFFARVDLAVFPSVWPETFGLVVAEAMAARVPFVISDAGALPEVAGGGHPWVAPAGDPELLAHTIGAALDADPAVATQAAHERWRSEYSAGAGSLRLAGVLRDLGVLDTSDHP